MINFSNPSKSSALKLFILEYFIFFKFLDANAKLLSGLSPSSMSAECTLNLRGF